LGLHDAVRAANSHLKSRRSELVRKIHLAQKGGQVDLLKSLRSHVVALEMQDALLSIDSSLQAHITVAEQKLQTAATNSFSSALFASYFKVHFFHPSILRVHVSHCCAMHFSTLSIYL
jgi:hypothetical protein